MITLVLMTTTTVVTMIGFTRLVKMSKSEEYSNLTPMAILGSKS